MIPRKNITIENLNTDISNLSLPLGALILIKGEEDNIEVQNYISKIINSKIHGLIYSDLSIEDRYEIVDYFDKYIEKYSDYGIISCGVIAEAIDRLIGTYDEN